MKTSNAFNQLTYRYLPYWTLFLLLVVACCLAARYYIRFITPLYESTATILIKDETQESADVKMMEALNMLPFKKNVENELQIIQSRTIMRRVIEQLGLYAEIFEEGEVQPVPAYTSSPISIKAKYPERLAEYHNIPFRFDSAKNIVIIGNADYPIDTWTQTKYGELMFIKNIHLVSAATKPLFFSITHPANVTKALLANLNVFPVNRNSSVVVLKFKDHVPKKGEDILNALCKEYYQTSINSKNAQTSSTMTFVEDRIKYVEDDLDSLEKKIEHYKAEKGITDLSAQGQYFLENVGTNDKKMAEIKIQLAVLDEVEKYVDSKKDKAGIVPSTLGISDPLLNQLLQKLYDAEISYDKLSKITAPNNPSLLAIKSEQEKIRPSILEVIGNLRTSLTTSLQNINKSRDQYASLLSTIPQKEKDLLDFSRQQAIKSSVYTFLLQKREETALSNSTTVADSEIIDAAESSMIPNSPNKSIIYLMALGMGVLLGIGIITIREMLNAKILFRHEIESYTSAPVIAELTQAKTQTPLAVDDPKQVFISEQFRQLRTSLGLYGEHRYNRKMLVSSSISGEGKSFVSSNLAVSIALSGKKIVLLDLDLRKRRTSEIFNLPNENGVIEFLENSKNPEEIIQKTAYKNLFVIPAGISENPASDLLLNGNLAALIKFLENKFDYILLDGPPIDPVADTCILGEFCDITLFVVRHGVTPKSMIQLLDTNTKIKSFKNLSIIFNGIKPRGFMIGKGYGFGYGYGFENVYKNYRYKVRRA
ncbi:polysaccharide biosynthesis tyrosine autokinase [Danxiaibacter flavus]|uniref:non-specific protein-tyrosine kinase n=1 Tax=Danxiaibacter flavus TaxID=3049108 RepID=A0ABV3ZLF4_9BACT|nr:polysaccharide biosynthesis tyrosine autokinase [Chitinophagaceae bacterium DXS]